MMVRNAGYRETGVGAAMVIDCPQSGPGPVQPLFADPGPGPVLDLDPRSSPGSRSRLRPKYCSIINFLKNYFSLIFIYI